MTMIGDVAGWSRSAEGPTASTPLPPTISPNRRRLDRASPSLAFTVTSTKAFVEVVLTTDRTLFDPKNAARRTPNNFFASRVFGLTQLGGRDTTYMVPAAVVRAFLEARPRPREIFYTAIGYDDESARTPALAQPASDLVAHAPSISIAPDFTVHGLSRAYGTALGRLVRHEAGAASAAYAAATAPANPPAAGGRTWTGSGAIRLPLGASLDDATPTYEERAYGGDDGNDYGYGAEDPDEGGQAASAAACEQCTNGARAQSFEYDDGFGALDDDDDRPRGAEPAELVEDDYASSYGDEADGDAPGARASATNGAPAAAPTPSAVDSPIASAVPPAASELRPLLERVARRHDGRSLHTTARASSSHGLRFGIGSFDQRSGALGRLLARMNQIDSAAFTRIFQDGAQQLLAVTTAPSPDVRMGAVAGRPLSDPSWIARFEQAGAHPAFVDAQNDVLVATVLAPMWPVLSGFGLTSDRATAALLALGIHMGPADANAWIASHLSPVQTPEQLRQALAAIGAPDLAAFQRDQRIEPSGKMDPITQAAVVRALRRLGASATMPVQTPQQMLEALVRHLGQHGVGRKIAALVGDATLGDRAR
jgi:hypothetical protein